MNATTSDEVCFDRKKIYVMICLENIIFLPFSFLTKTITFLSLRHSYLFLRFGDRDLLRLRDRREYDFTFSYFEDKRKEKFNTHFHGPSEQVRN